MTLIRVIIGWLIIAGLAFAFIWAILVGSKRTSHFHDWGNDYTEDGWVKRDCEDCDAEQLKVGGDWG